MTFKLECYRFDIHLPHGATMSAESDVLREHYDKLYEIIHNADALAMQLYSNGLIAKSLRSDIQDSSRQPEKNKLLLGAVERVITADHRKLHEFMEVLSGEPYLQHIVESMKSKSVLDCVCC